MAGGFRVRERSVLHFNVADFAVAVERVDDCRLRQRPLLIAPLQAARAVVYDMSEEAYREGVRKGMPLRQAITLGMVTIAVIARTPITTNISISEKPLWPVFDRNGVEQPE